MKPGGKKEGESAEELSRRKFFTTVGLGVGWGGIMATLGGVGAGTLRYIIPNILYEPPTIFKIGTPDSYGIGVDTKLKKERQIWVVRNERGIYVLISICRHLGCTPNWFGDQKLFRCPCHGSIYDTRGNVVGGPAPRTLWRAAISLDPVDGQIVVNFNTRQDPDPKGTAEGLMVEEMSREVEPYFLKV
ncbi:MAG: ubiquinol-cytochrome c reductase iron-sulfur subunit [Nitrospiria bacterium]